MVNYIEDQEEKDFRDTLKELSDYIRRWESEHGANMAEVREDIGLMKYNIDKDKLDLDDILADLKANDSKMESYNNENRDIINKFYNRIFVLEQRINNLENRLQRIERRENNGNKK